MNEIRIKKDEIIRLLDERRYGELLREISELPAIDAAEIFEDIPDEYQTKFF